VPSEGSDTWLCVGEPPHGRGQPLDRLHLDARSAPQHETTSAKWARTRDMESHQHEFIADPTVNPSIAILESRRSSSWAPTSTSTPALERDEGLTRRQHPRMTCATGSVRWPGPEGCAAAVTSYASAEPGRNRDAGARRGPPPRRIIAGSSGVVLVAARVVWLAVFFLVPLRSSSSAWHEDAAGHVVLAGWAQNTLQRRGRRRTCRLSQLAKLRVDHAAPLERVGYRSLLDPRLRRPAQILRSSSSCCRSGEMNHPDRRG